MRVLVVDDSVVMRMIIERGLRHAGLGDAEICHAGNGMEALAQMERVKDRGESFDLIFTDVHMPVMNGLELLAEVKRKGLGGEAPVVMITAEDSAGRLGGDAGVKGFHLLTKPFTLEQMQACVSAVLPVARR